ncbi:hypothetical protein SAMN04487943_106192 [Gracilibacillus orientalis]|uniref:Uncharacterized protein n=1 Tax=Gracilibacillus orientalis TaxID=334253 RepID=A0A1I4ME28_9BACI|nr:hypothetical protein [Gracilibacillus orientalis]SFM01440.1 hypothetical protein SAMN04487943_106192 [Gracilibacillus orientalis]
MKKIVLVSLMLLIACSNQDNEPMITKEDPEQPIDELLDQEAVQETSQETENPEVEFVLKDEIITLNTENITILGAYLNTVNNRNRAISNMKLDKLELDRLYLLSFNCSSSTCSYLLLDRNEPNRSFLVDDLINLKDVILSPDQSKLLFIINESQTDSWKVFNIEEWATVQFEPSPPEKISIQTANWHDEESFTIEYQQLPDNTAQEMIIKEQQEQLHN